MNFKIKDFLRKNVFPIIVEIALIISFLYLPSHAHIYVNTLFYLLLFGYIIYRKDFSLNAWITKIKSGKRFLCSSNSSYLPVLQLIIVLVYSECVWKNYRSHGKPIYNKGNKYITPDVDSHNGSVWKMTYNIENLMNKNPRLGTYKKLLERIGD